LEIIRITAGEVLVKKASKGKGSIPSWGGGRMPLSSTFSQLLRMKMNELAEGKNLDKELSELAPLVEIQKMWSVVPRQDEFLIEYFKTKEGWHLCFYPFEGRYIHEILASLVAFRIASTQPISFSLAMNDYGFELLSDEKVDIEYALNHGLLSVTNLTLDINNAVNSNELAKRKFREIAQISGLLFVGYPGQSKKNKQIHSSTSLLFEVFKEYEPENLLFQQAYSEVLTYQLDENRLSNCLTEIENQEIIIKNIKQPTPFGFQIMVDRLREKISSEKIEDRVRKLLLEYSTEQK
jgi:ATP-dependent Lhr-like helicase